MALPKAVQAQIDEANQLQEQMVASGAVEETVGSIVAEAGAAPENATTVVADAPTGEVVELQPGVEPVPVTEPVVPAPPVEDPPPAPEDWQHKYEVLQGKYNAEVPRLSRQVNDMGEQMQGLQNVLATMQAAPAAAPAAPVAAEQTFAANNYGTLTPDEIADYGEDFIDVVKRVAQQAYGPEMNTLRTENEELKKNFNGVTQTVAATQDDRFYSQLEQNVEDWQGQNHDEGFLNWLNEVDPYTGARRQQMLQRAFEEKDVNRVAAFFMGYRQEHATVSGQAPTAPALAPAAAVPQVNLEDLAAPGRSKSGTSNNGAPQESRIYSQAEISQFYREVQKGSWATRDDDKVRIESDIIAAAREGRIR